MFRTCFKTSPRIYQDKIKPECFLKTTKKSPFRDNGILRSGASLKELTCWIFAGICMIAFAGPVFSAGISPPSPTDEGRALLKARAYHLAMECFLLVQEKSENFIEKAQALRLIGETQFHEKDYAAAYQAYQQSLRLNPITMGALGLEFKSAVSLVYLKNYTVAVTEFKALEKRAVEKDAFATSVFGRPSVIFNLNSMKRRDRNTEKSSKSIRITGMETWCDISNLGVISTKGISEIP